MKVRHPWLIGLLALLGSVLIRLWMSTVRVRKFVADHAAHPVDPRIRRYIYAIWHESILAPTVFKIKIRILISQHADGELIARACRYLGFGVVRGSTTRGGANALLEMRRVSKDFHLLVTPDGPRGPRRQLALGIIFLASSTGLPILPVGVGFVNAWRFRSWDRFALPVPFSTVMCVAGAPIHVPTHLDRKGLQEYRLLVEEEMLKATTAAEEWAQTGVRPDREKLWPLDSPVKASA